MKVLDRLTFPARLHERLLTVSVRLEIVIKQIRSKASVQTFELEPSNDLERIAENVHGTVTSTFQIERSAVNKTKDKCCLK